MSLYSDTSLALSSSDGGISQIQRFTEIIVSLLSQSDKRFPDFSRGVRLTCKAQCQYIIRDNVSTMRELDVRYTGDACYRMRIGEL